MNVDFNTMSLADWCNLRPIGGFQVIYADPAWRFASNSAEKPGKNARAHYDCMTLDQIKDMPIKAMAADNALLLLWVTVPLAEAAFSVVNEWGFRYKSQLVWDKGRIGSGYWARNRHELLYICRRGRFPCEMPALFPTSVMSDKRREHSRKPDWPVEIIDRRYPEMSKLELNGRAQRPGWTVLGNETEKFS